MVGSSASGPRQNVCLCVCPLGAPNRKEETNTPGIFRPGILLLWKIPPLPLITPGVVFFTNNTWALRGAFTKEPAVQMLIGVVFRLFWLFYNVGEALVKTMGAW